LPRLLGFLLTPFGADPSGRYFLPLIAPLAIFAGELLAAVRTPLWSVWSGALLAGMLLFHLSASIQAASANPPGFIPNSMPGPGSTTPTTSRWSVLAYPGRDAGGTELLEFAYPLAFLSRERLLFVPDLPTYADLRHTAARQPLSALCRRRLPTRSVSPTSRPGTGFARARLRAELGGRVEWREAAVGDYHVFYDLSRPVRSLRSSDPRALSPWSPGTGTGSGEHDEFRALVFLLVSWPCF